MNPKVLMLLTNAFDPDPRVYQEAKALVESGYDVTILCWDRDHKASAHEVIDGIQIERIYVRSTHGRGTTQGLFLFLFWLKAFIRVISRKLHFIHCHDFDTLPLGFFLAKLKRVRVIYDSHESYVDMLAGNVSNYIKNLLVTIEDFLIAYVDCVITVGPTLSHTFSHRGAKRVAVVGNWKDISNYNVSCEKLDAVRVNLSIPKGKIVICYIGHLHPRRIITQLLDSINSNEPYYLIIGGYGELVEDVQSYARHCDNIKYLGYVRPQDIPLYTGVSDVIYSAFDCGHPMAKYIAPNKLFDALAAGKAVLTGDFGEVGQIVKEERCGIVLKNYGPKNFDDALSRLAENQSILLTYFKNAKRASKKYNWDVAKRTLLDIYQK